MCIIYSPGFSHIIRTQQFRLVTMFTEYMKGYWRRGYERWGGGYKFNKASNSSHWSKYACTVSISDYSYKSKPDIWA